MYISPRILSSPVPAIKFLFTINDSCSMGSVSNNAKYIGNANFGYISIRLFCYQHISVDPNNPIITWWRFKVFVYSIQSFIRWCCSSGVCRTSFNNGKMELFKGVGVRKHFFPARYKLHVCTAVVSADRKFAIKMTSSFWWSFSITSHHISSGMLIVGTTQECSYFFSSGGTLLYKIGVGKSHCTH